MSWNNLIPRANLPISYEGSPLVSPRESNAPGHLWKRTQAASSRAAAMTRFAVQVMQRINAAHRPNFGYAYSVLHPFKLYNFPSFYRQVQNADDWRRLKVRYGLLGSDQADNSDGFTVPFGCDLDPNDSQAMIDPSQEVFLTTEVPPTDGSSFVANSAGPPKTGWHEFVIPDTGDLYYFWVSVSLTAVGEAQPVGVMVGTTNTNAYSMQSGTSGLSEVWPTFPQNDPYHFLIGRASAFQGTLLVSQQQFDHIYYTRNSRLSGATSGATAMSFRDEYSAIKYYFCGDVVTVTDTPNGVVKTFIMFPKNIGDGGTYGPEYGPIVNITPGGANTPDPWVLLSQSPINESVEFTAAAFDNTKGYLREI